VCVQLDSILLDLVCVLPERLPHFVALTADVKGLLAHPDNRGTFDLAIAKPIDVPWK
jgi:LmbE family N-acetylglucosaminyl deacetylase